MKKTIIIITLLFIASFNLIANEQKDWMEWFQERNWVMEDNSEVPIYESLDLFILNADWEILLIGEDTFVTVTGKTYVFGEKAPMKLVIYIKKDPIVIDIFYLEIGTKIVDLYVNWNFMDKIFLKSWIDVSIDNWISKN